MSGKRNGKKNNFFFREGKGFGLSVEKFVTVRRRSRLICQIEGKGVIRRSGTRGEGGGKGLEVQNMIYERETENER